MPTPTKHTLLGVIQHVSNSPKTDAEVVATVVDLINSGRVRPCGALAGTRLVVHPSLSAFLAWVRSPASVAAPLGLPAAVAPFVARVHPMRERQHDGL